jgi:hypothetical protein
MVAQRQLERVDAGVTLDGFRADRRIVGLHRPAGSSVDIELNSRPPGSSCGPRRRGTMRIARGDAPASDLRRMESPRDGRGMEGLQRQRPTGRRGGRAVRPKGSGALHIGLPSAGSGQGLTPSASALTRHPSRESRGAPRPTRVERCSASHMPNFA